ncbi:MAG: tRNA pseudouridine synthase A [Ignisphaera sp.]
MREKGIEFIKLLDRAANIDHEYVVKYDEDTDEKHGSLPYARSIQDHIHSSLIVLDKPPGPTSHEVVAWIKKMFNLEKAGHGGTLELSP